MTLNPRVWSLQPTLSGFWNGAVRISQSDVDDKDKDDDETEGGDVSSHWTPTRGQAVGKVPTCIISFNFPNTVWKTYYYSYFRSEDIEVK